jgi:hypothetical protein
VVSFYPKAFNNNKVVWQTYNPHTKEKTKHSCRTEMYYRINPSMNMGIPLRLLNFSRHPLCTGLFRYSENENVCTLDRPSIKQREHTGP